MGVLGEAEMDEYEEIGVEGVEMGNEKDVCGVVVMTGEKGVAEGRGEGAAIDGDENDCTAAEEEEEEEENDVTEEGVNGDEGGADSMEGSDGEATERDENVDGRFWGV